MGDLDGRVALVTGGARGMGRSHAVALARAGADVALIDWCSPMPSVGYELASPADLDETVALVEAEGRRAFAARADVRDFPELDSAVAAAAAHLGRLDVVVANAGVSGGDGIRTADPSQWQDVIGVNLTGTFHTFRAAAAHVVASTDPAAITGRMIGVASMIARAPSPGMGAYVASKWGVIGLVKSVAQDLAGFGITVNAVAPGNIDTPMVRNEALARKVRPDLENPRFEDAESLLAMLHVQRVALIAPEAVSDAVLFLAGPSGRHITGAVIDVNAGASARTSS